MSTTATSITSFDVHDLGSCDAPYQSDSSDIPPPSSVELKKSRRGGSTRCLSFHTPRGQLNNWRISAIQASGEEPIHPLRIVGSVARVAEGRTSRIDSFDPMTRRILTITGSVYQLGAPDPVFANTAPNILEQLGFGVQLNKGRSALVEY